MARLSDASLKLVEDVKSSMRSRVRKEVAQNGWAEAESLVSAIEVQLASAASVLDDEARTEQDRSAHRLNSQSKAWFR